VEALKRRIDAVRRKRGELWREIAHWFFATTTRRHILRFECRIFLQEKASLPWIIRHTLPTWLQVTFDCFQSLRVCSNESGSRTLRTLNHLWKKYDKYSCSGFS
jgi:hypothetical protein